MEHENLPKSDLVQLKKEVLDLPPEFSLPRNLPDYWLDMLARDLDEVVEIQRYSGDALAVYAAAPMALIFNILRAKCPGPELSMSCEEFWEYCVDLQIEINLEIVNRRTAHKIEPATLKEIFTNRQVHVIPAP